MPEIRARIEKQLRENPIVLYMKGTPNFPMCGFSGRVVSILNKHKVDFFAVNDEFEPQHQKSKASVG